MTIQEFTRRMSTRFVFAEQTARDLYAAIITQRHIILWGPGGHAKSAMAEEAIKLMMPDPSKFYQDTYMASCSGRMDATPFVGYTDIKKLREDGKHSTILEETVFVQSQYAILEEGFDAPDDLLLSLKDGLQRGYICVNGQCLQNKLKTLVICTNVNPKEWAGEDMSRNALLGRFALQTKVEWPAYTAKEFGEMFTTIGTPDLVVSELAARCHTTGFKISPRDSVMMKQLYDTVGVEALQNFRGMTPAAYTAVKAFITSIPYIRQLEEMEGHLQAAKQATTEEEMKKGLWAFQNIQKKLKQIPADGVYSGKLKTMLVEYREIQDAWLNPVARAKNLLSQL